MSEGDKRGQSPAPSQKVDAGSNAKDAKETIGRNGFFGCPASPETSRWRT